MTQAFRTHNKVKSDMHSKSVVMVVLAICAVSATAAQSQTSTWDGVYTDAQAARGSSKYVQCAMCHGTVLEGNGEAPPLTGRFIPDWAGTTLADLFDKVQTTMPLYAPGTLSAGDTTDLIAFLLKSNNFPAGSTELAPSTDVLKTISFDAAKPPTNFKSVGSGSMGSGPKR
jgi:S-disulfanyl-L-cysteine oxidoreductase SoxD